MDQQTWNDALKAVESLVEKHLELKRLEQKRSDLAEPQKPEILESYTDYESYLKSIDDYHIAYNDITAKIIQIKQDIHSLRSLITKLPKQQRIRYLNSNMVILHDNKYLHVYIDDRNIHDVYDMEP